MTLEAAGKKKLKPAQLQQHHSHLREFTCENQAYRKQRLVWGATLEGVSVEDYDLVLANKVVEVLSHRCDPAPTDFVLSRCHGTEGIAVRIE